MADLFRIVTIGEDGRARVLEDLMVRDVIYRQRDTFSVTPGAGRARTAAGTGRYTGSRTTGETRDNGAIAATLAVKGATPDEAAANVERLLERLSSSRRDLFIEWRPEGLGKSAYSEIRGPGAATPTYRWVEWNGVRRLTVGVSWPTAPLPQGLPLAIYERWEPPADKPGGIVNLVPDPNGAGGTSWTGNYSGTASTVDPNASTGDPELGGPGRGRYWSWTSPAGGSPTPQYPLFTANGEVSAPVIPGRYYAVRARIKIRRAFTNVAATPWQLRGAWTGAGNINFSAASSGANAGTYPINSVIDLAAIVQAPAGFNRLSLGLQVDGVGTGTGDGAIRFGMFMIAEVPSATSPIPAYGDGERDGYRWEGLEHRSRSRELTESKLADYTRPTAAAGVERINPSNGVYQGFQAAADDKTGALVHQAREPVADGEAMVTVSFEQAIGVSTFTNVAAPGIKYSPIDGRFFYARVTGSLGGGSNALELRYWDGINDVLMVASGGFSGVPSTGRTVTLAIRSEGNSITADWYGTVKPNGDRGNYLNRVRFTMDETTSPKASEMGADRIGYPMPRARGMTGGAAGIVKFDWRPFLFTERRLPDTIPLKIPGTARALVKPAIGWPGGAGIPAAQEWGDHAFGLFSWRRRQGRENMAWNGDGIRGGGWTPVNGGGLVPNTNGGAAGQPGAPSDAVQTMVIQGSASIAQSGADFVISRPFRRGQPYTIDFWWLTFTPTDVNLVKTDTAGGTTTSNIALGLNGQPFQRRTYTFTPTAELTQIAVRFTMPATSSQAQISALQVYEGDTSQAPLEYEQTSGRGAFPAFGVIQAENTYDPFTVSTTDAANLHNGRRINITSAGTAAYTPAEYLIDPNLLVPPDFAGDTVDVTVFVGGIIDANVPNAMAVASARHEADIEGGARIYTNEFGTAGRRLFGPGTPATKTGFVAVLGTLSLGIRGGRYVLRINVQPGTTAGLSVGLDTIVLAPIRSTASTPTGKTFTGYPLFAPWVWQSSPATATIGHERYLEPDGSARTIMPDGTAYPFGSIGGESIELEPGDADLLAWTYPGIPSQPDQSAGVGGLTGRGPLVAVRADIVPRYRLMPA